MDWGEERETGEELSESSGRRLPSSSKESINHSQIGNETAEVFERKEELLGKAGSVSNLGLKGQRTVMNLLAEKKAREKK